MKPHHQRGVLVLALALLALAAVLGVSRWNQSVPTSQPTAKSAPAEQREGFVELPRASDPSSVANGTLPTKGSQRLLQAGNSQGVELQPDQPRPGEVTYRMADLPTECGTYWVESAGGGFRRLAVCHPESHSGGAH